MEAQRYPDDYDAIIAGAPWNQWTHQNVEFISRALALEQLDPAKRSMITGGSHRTVRRTRRRLSVGWLSQRAAAMWLQAEDTAVQERQCANCLTASEVNAVDAYTQVRSVQPPA